VGSTTPAPLPNASLNQRGVLAPGPQTIPSGPKAFPDAPDFTAAGTTNPHYIDATAYGLKASKTAPENETAMAAAIAATPANWVLLIPTGRFKINLHGRGALNHQFIFTRSITLKGAGKGQTILKADGFVEGAYSNHGTQPNPNWLIDAPNDNGAALFLRGGGTHNVLITDMTLEGPDAGDITGDNNVCWAIYSRGGGGKLELERVDTLLWNQAIKCSPDSDANGTPNYPSKGTQFKATDCSLGFLSSNGVLMIESPYDLGPDGTNSCRLVRCIGDGNDFGHPTQAMQPTSNGEYACTYINRGVNFEAIDCWFKKSLHGIDRSSPSHGFLHYGGGYLPNVPSSEWYVQGVGGIPQFSRAINCIFDDCENQLLSCQTAPTMVQNCEFHTRAGYIAAQVNNDLHLTDCKFRCEDGAVYFITDSNGHEGAVFANGCVFGTVGQGGGAVYSVRRFLDHARPWKLSNCHFEDVFSGGSAIGLDAGSMDLHDLTFNVQNGVFSVRVSGGDCRAGNLHFCEGSKPIYVDGFVGDASFEWLPGHHYDGDAQFQIQKGGVGTVTLRGVPKFWKLPGDPSQGIFIVASAGVASLSGTLTLAPGIGDYFITGSDVHGDWNHDTLVIDEPGNPSFDNFYLYGQLVPGVTHQDYLRFFTGRVYLVVQQGFAWSGNGNVVPKTTAQRAVGTILVYQYVPALGKFYEV
jgi:hypothetical protein